MPFLQHQGVGPHLKFARSDHAIPIPRPAFDQSIGVENACQKCHQDKSIEWQEGKVREFWGKIKPHNPVVANVIRTQAEDMNAAAARALLLQTNELHPMAQITELGNYIQKHVFPIPGDMDTATTSLLTNYLASKDVDLKSLAFTTLKLKSQGNYKLPEVDEVALRNRWSLLADEFGSAYAAGGNFEEAIKAFTSSLEANSSNEVAMSHLAFTHLRAGNFDRAIHWLQEAIRVKPYQAVLYFQLAQTYAHIQDIPRAIASLEQGLKYAPTDTKAKSLLESLKSQQLTR